MSFWSAVGTMFGSLDILQGGLIIIAGAAAFGASRAMTKEKEMWLPTLTIFCWLGALILAETPEASILYLIGALASTATYMQIFKHEKNERINLLHIALIGLFINLSLTAGAYYFNEDVQTTIDQSLAGNILGDTTKDTTNSWVEEYQEGKMQIETGLCEPGDTTCSSDIQVGSVDSQNFDIITAVLNTGQGIEKAIRFAGLSLIGPVALGNEVSEQISDPIMGSLVFLLLNIWTLAIVYHTIMFLLNNRGA